MSLQAISFEQSFGTFFTGLYCTVGAKGDGPTILKRANTALAVSAALTALGQGNIAEASSVILAAIQSNPDLDPAMALALNNALQLVFMQWQGLQGVNAMLPFLSTSVEALVSSFAAGVIAGANAEIAKYSIPTAKTS